MNPEKFDCEAEYEGCGGFVSDIVDCLPVDPFGIDVLSSGTATDCLPVDPFGMELMPSGVDVSCLPVDPVDLGLISRDCAIKEWLQNFDEEFEANFGKYGVDEAEKDSVRHGLLAGLDLFFNSAVKLEEEKGDLGLDAMLIQNHSARRIGSSDGKDDISNTVEEEGGNPHDGLFYALSYLGVEDLLAVERVCKSLRDAVRGDSLLWRSVHVDHPLNLKLTDEALVGLTSRAQGNLQCLSLVECIKITDKGLKQVLDNNPGLTKLGVRGCVRLSIGGILSNMRVLKSSGTLKIKQLLFGGLFCITKEQFEEFKSILDVDSERPLESGQPRYYPSGHMCVSLDDNRALDIEICPKCQKVKLVYDCPSKSCQGKDTATELCRACTLCISRCICCGRCVEDPNYEETFCLDSLCLVCLERLLSCEEKPEVKNMIARAETI